MHKSSMGSSFATPETDTLCDAAAHAPSRPLRPQPYLCNEELPWVVGLMVHERGSKVLKKLRCDEGEVGQSEHE